MSNSEPLGSSGDNPADDEPELLDINGNPIPRNWDPSALPAPPDAELPPAKPSDSRNSNGTRSSNGVRPATPGSRPKPPRPIALPALMPGEEERLDLAGMPLPPLKASLPPPPAYRSPSMATSRPKSGGGNSAAPIFAILLVLLIAGAGYVIYTKYTANQKNLATTAAPISETSKGPSGTKPHSAHKKPFGGTN